MEVLRSSVNLPHELHSTKIEESTRGEYSSPPLIICAFPLCSCTYTQVLCVASAGLLIVQCLLWHPSLVLCRYIWVVGGTIAWPMKSKRFRYIHCTYMYINLLLSSIRVMQATCMCWSPEGSYLTTLDEDGTLKVSYNTITGLHLGFCSRGAKQLFTYFMGGDPHLYI